MLNTIYEEFDFESKIAELKRKKIKIKRVIKKGDLSESIILDNTENMSMESVIVDRNFQNKSQYTLDDSQKNQINDDNESVILERNFQSQESNINQLQTNIQNIDQHNSNIKNSVGQLIKVDRKNHMMFQSLAVDSSPYNKKENNQEMDNQNQEFYQKSNILYKSQILTKDSAIIQSEFSEFVLPSQVTKYIREEEINIFKVTEHINKEKQKVDEDIDNIIYEITSKLNRKRQQLHQKFDEFFEMYQKNYFNLNERIAQFRKESRIPQEQKNIGLNNLITLKSIAFYGKEAKSFDQQKFKEEYCRVQSTTDKIDREVNKKLICYLQELLNKQQIHLPTYKNTDTSNVLLSEFKENYTMDNNIEVFDHLVYVPPYNDFKTFHAEPQVSSIIGEDRISAIGDFRKLKNMSVENIQKFQTSHLDAILTICALNEELIITGSKHGVLKIHNIIKNQEILTLVAHSNVAITSLQILKIYESELNNAQLQNSLKKLFSKTFEIELKFFLSGGQDAAITLWEITSDIQVIEKKSFRGHSDAITAMVALQDFRTFISSSKDSNIVIWDAKNNKILKQLNDHHGSVNCLSLSKDFNLLFSGSSDHTIKIWSLNYEFCIQHQRNMFSNAKLSLSIQDQCSIYTLNTSYFNQNNLFSGGSDCKIKIWNIKEQTIQKEIIGHKSPVCQIILLENPFEYDKNFTIVSSGTQDQFLRITNASQMKFHNFNVINNALVIDQIVTQEYGAFVSPLLQVIKDNKEINDTPDSIQLVAVSQNPDLKFFLVYTIK